MNSFIQKHQADVIGVLSGFDRLVFRGTLRGLSYVDGMARFLAALGVLLKDFGAFAERVSQQVKQASLAAAERAGRPVLYLPSSAQRKDQLARSIASRDGIDNGLICVFKTVEPLFGFDIFRNRETKKLELQMRQRKCLHFYHYIAHPLFGFIHVRLQTWLPLQVQVWINGREWLARTLDDKSIGYVKRDNCFPCIDDVERAQRLMNKQTELDWALFLNALLSWAHPAHASVFAPLQPDYYWSAYQSEWATDVMFRNRPSLQSLYQRLVHQGITRFDCGDVLRFLGRNVAADGSPHSRFAGEVTSDLKRRPEGIRLKHRVGGNSVKIYDKHGTVLRVETTITEPGGFKVYRPAEGDDHRSAKLRPMRKGVSDLFRRTEVSQAVNDRYLNALASFEDSTSLGELTRGLCRPKTWKGRRVRALHLWSPDDLALLRAVAKGDFNATGFRNADLCRALHTTAPRDTTETRRRSAATTRKVRLLRAHGLLAKRPRSHRYLLTAKGQQVTSALLAAYQANTESLSKLAA